MAARRAERSGMLSSIGFALIGQDLRVVQTLLQRIGDVCVLCSLLVPIGLLALLKLADRMLPNLQQRLQRTNASHGDGCCDRPSA